MESKKQITAVINKISKKFHAKKTFIFGSYAYGQPSNDSDLDICIIIDLGNKRKIDIVRDIRRELSSLFKSPLDILLYDMHPTPVEIICYHCQQSSEKFLKGFLALNEHEKVI